ncbi:MAG: LytTR family transcriptional regulator DNA-binding domain-containing protein [Gemmatimonadaceae bacterium]|nr:LytTR family transcriptional regulator DNA-binding domain-containing protein [Chitinophagaceae bacterium]
MKVIIVEEDKQTARAVIRVLKMIDESIKILAVANSLDTLHLQIGTYQQPDLVLINKQLIGETHYEVEARLLVTFNGIPLSYHAFRLNTLKLLPQGRFKQASSPDPKSGESCFPSVSGRPLDKFLATPPFRKRFLVTHKQEFLSIDVQDIAYFFSDNRFIFFKTFDNRKFLVEYRVDEIESMLDPLIFFRINRAYIISIHALSFIQPYPGGRFKISLNPPVDKELIVSRERLSDFRIWLGE